MFREQELCKEDWERVSRETEGKLGLETFTQCRESIKEESAVVQDACKR